MYFENPEKAFEDFIDSDQAEELFHEFFSAVRTAFLKGYQAGMGIEEGEPMKQ